MRRILLPAIVTLGGVLVLLFGFAQRSSAVIPRDINQYIQAPPKCEAYQGLFPPQGLYASGPPTVTELTRDADLIVHGTIDAVETRALKVPSDFHPQYMATVTYATLTVRTSYKGDKLVTVVLTQPGPPLATAGAPKPPTPDGPVSQEPSPLTFRRGQELVLFLQAVPDPLNAGATVYSLPDRGGRYEIIGDTLCTDRNVQPPNYYFPITVAELIDRITHGDAEAVFVPTQDLSQMRMSYTPKPEYYPPTMAPQPTLDPAKPTPMSYVIGTLTPEPGADAAPDTQRAYPEPQRTPATERAGTP